MVAWHWQAIRRSTVVACLYIVEQLSSPALEEAKSSEMTGETLPLKAVNVGNSC